MKTKYTTLLLTIFLFTSCGDFLKEYSQDTAYVRSYVDLDELLLGSGYMSIASLTTTAKSYYPYIHMMADELKENITTTEQALTSDMQQRFFGWYTWQKQTGISEDGLTLRNESNDWNLLYNHISIANMVLASIDGQSARNDNERKEISRIKGEAYFLRAAYYFVLTNLYGKPYQAATASSDLGVPIKTTEFIEDRIFARNTVQQVYDQILADLAEAEKALENTRKLSIHRANITAVQLLKARVYLYMQNWEDAQDYAQKVIDSDYSLANLNTFTGSAATGEFVLTPGSPEVIFTMGPGEIGRTINGHTTGMSVSDDLYAVFEDGDLRKEKYVLNNAAVGYVDYIKVDPFVGRSGLSDNFVLRTAEAYLIKAEAAALAGEEGTARLALNNLRRSRLRDAAYADVTVSGETLVNFIRDERRRELCFEGHRWFDLRRYAVSNPYPYSKRIYNSITTFDYRYVGSPVWGYRYFQIQTRIFELLENDPAYTLPIPREVLDFNTGMPDNERPDRPPFQTITY